LSVGNDREKVIGCSKSPNRFPESKKDAIYLDFSDECMHKIAAYL